MLDLGAAVVAAERQGLLVNGGGHAMAAGVTVEAAKIGELTEFLEAALGTEIDAARALNELVLDGVLLPQAANFSPAKTQRT